MPTAHGLAVLEMLFVNLYTSYMCSRRRTTPLLTWMGFVLFTAIFAALVFPLITKAPNYGNGNGLFMVVGFLYVIPMKFLYDQSTKYTILIMCSSWLYTMLVFSLSFRLGYLLPEASLGQTVLFVQTVIYVLTLPYFLKFVREKFVFIVRNVESKTLNSILVLSFLWFTLILLVNFIFVQGSTPLLEFLILAVCAASVVLSYRLFYVLVFVDKAAKTLREETKTDPLTKLRNRDGLYEDVLQVMEKGCPFSVIFMDLDDFKNVNDRYGHSIGDAYLVQFTETVQTIINVNCRIYRMSGDEFVVLYTGNELETLCRKLAAMDFGGSNFEVPFGGLSLGFANYPVDGTDFSHLLHFADTNMYQQKKEKHCKVQT